MKVSCLLLAMLLICLSSCAYAVQIDGGSTMTAAPDIRTDEQYVVVMNDSKEILSIQAEEGSAFYRVDFNNENKNPSINMTLFDSAGLKLQEKRVYGGDSGFLSWKAESGAKYYLQFYQGSGTFEEGKTRFGVTLTRTPDEYDDEMEGAGVIALDQHIVSSFDGSGDIDYMTFIAQEGNTYYRADFKNETIDSNTHMTLLDENGLKIKDVDAYRDRSNAISWLAEPGKTYYLKFTRSAEHVCGRYSVSLSSQIDAEGQSLETAISLLLDQVQQGSFDGSDDIDYMTFIAQEGKAYYRADFKNETVDSNMHMTLLDENGLKIKDVDAYRDRSNAISWLAEPGKTYYLKFTRSAEHACGRYSILLSRQIDNEGNDPASAEDCVMNTLMQGSFDGSADIDVFRITAGEGNLYYNVPFTNKTVDTTVYMTLLDHNGLKLAQESASQDRSNAISWKAEPGAVYYLSFTRYDENRSGTYIFTINEIADCESDTLAGDVQICNAEAAQYTLGNESDTDWFGFVPVNVPSYVSLSIVNQNGDVIEAAICDGNGKELDSRRIYKGNEWKPELYLSPEVMLYLRVTGEDSCSYTITRADTEDIGGNSPADAVQLVPLERLTVFFEKANETDYAVFPGAGSNILLVASSGSSLYASVVDGNGQRVTDEYRVREGDSRVFCAERGDLYLCLKGSGSCQLTACTSDEHAPSGLWAIVKAPSCTEEGEEVMLCTICGDTADKRTVPASGHIPSPAYTLVRNPGCDDAGLEELHCAYCYTVLEQRTILATGHLNTYWKMVLEAGCETDGLQQRMCSGCGKQLEQERISATGHFAGKQIRIEPTCEKDGSEQKDCQLCGEVLEQQRIPSNGHAYGEWVQTQAPTKDAEGFEESVCADCGDVQTRSIEKLTFLEGLFGK